jgi:predicted RNase H-like HicB family nuclease
MFARRFLRLVQGQRLRRWKPVRWRRRDRKPLHLDHSRDTPVTASWAERAGRGLSLPRLGAQQYTVDMTFRVALECDPRIGDFSAMCPELPGCASASQTEAEARANIREAIELYLAPSDIELPDDATACRGDGWVGTARPSEP